MRDARGGDDGEWVAPGPDGRPRRAFRRGGKVAREYAAGEALKRGDPLEIGADGLAYRAAGAGIGVAPRRVAKGEAFALDDAGDPPLAPYPPG